MIRILIVEDRPEVRLGLQMRLSAEPDMKVVGMACDGPTGLESANELAPDVVLMDVEMPLQDGIETSVQFAARYPLVPVVILTIHDDSCTRARAREASVAGFVSKEKPVECLLSTIRDVARCNGAGRPV